MSQHTRPDLRYRAMLMSAAVAAAGAGAAAVSLNASAAPAVKPAANPNREGGHLTTRGGVTLHYKDWGPKDGQPVCSATAGH